MSCQKLKETQLSIQRVSSSQTFLELSVIDYRTRDLTHRYQSESLSDVCVRVYVCIWSHFSNCFQSFVLAPLILQICSSVFSISDVKQVPCRESVLYQLKSAPFQCLQVRRV